jgi:hypothetical protein
MTLVSHWSSQRVPIPPPIVHRALLVRQAMRAANEAVSSRGPLLERVVPCNRNTWEHTRAERIAAGRKRKACWTRAGITNFLATTINEARVA